MVMLRKCHQGCCRVTAAVALQRGRYPEFLGDRLGCAQGLQGRI
jgi:hypothetical protein